MTSEMPAEPVVPERPGLWSAALLAPLAVVVWWVAGFLPWIVNLFGNNILTVNGFSRAALPLVSGNSVTDLLVSTGLGSVGAGLTVLLGRRRPLASAVAVLAGVTVVAGLTVAQSRDVVGSAGADVAAVDGRLVDGLTALVVLTTVVGLAIGLLSLTGRAAAGLALAIVAGLVPAWTYALLGAVSFDLVARSSFGVDCARWLGAAALVAALVTIGLRSWTRLLWWLVAVLLAWTTGAVLTAAGYLGSSLTRGPRSAEAVREYVSAAWQVFGQAVTPGEQPVASWGAAVAVAAVLAGAIRLRAQRSTDPDQTPLDQTPPDQTPLDQTPPDQTPLDQTPLDQTVTHTNTTDLTEAMTSEKPGPSWP